VDEGGVAGPDLARRAAVSPSAVSQLLAGLEGAGLVERGRLADDRR
jgi:DNA-binding MarR family transcriptional regulator